MKNIKILISCHKPVELLKSNILIPIQVGCALNEERFGNMLRDNDGENISSKNPMYCELTAQFWAWKNLDADYYGFFHYRRYLNFSEKRFSKDCWGNVIEDYLLKKTARQYGLNDETMQSLIADYDMVISEMKDVSQMPPHDKSVYQQYKNGNSLHSEDLDIVIDIIKNRYPEYMDDLNKYLNGTKTCLCNMFIMKRELFFEYAKWLFDILFEFEKRADMEDYSVEGLRTPGHLAERLLTLYYIHLKRTRKLKIKELQTVVFLNTDPKPILKPAFDENNVAIVLSANDFYVPYVSVVLESLQYHATCNWNYDVIVMHKDISLKNQLILKEQLADKENICLRFLNIGRYSKPFEKMFLRGHFAVETYFRLLMPEILKKYSKALYMDSDLVMNADPGELYNTDVSGYLLAACHDSDTAGLYNGYEPNKKNYMDHILKIKKPYEYFQAGVILFNLAEFRKRYKTKELLQFAASNKWELLDQDVLNYIAQGSVKYVDTAWNVMTDWAGIRISQIIALAPKRMNTDYLKAHKNPKIIHYAGPDKPWHRPYEDKAEYFWKYARNCPYYEVILQRLYVLPSIPTIKERVKHTLLVTMMPSITVLFPYKTKRREYLKKIVRKFVRF